MVKYVVKSYLDRVILVEQKTREACQRWIEENCYEGARGFWYLNCNDEYVYIDKL
jgi:hypothetical protein